PRRHDGDLDARLESRGVDLPRADPDARRARARRRPDGGCADARHREASLRRRGRRPGQRRNRPHDRRTGPADTAVLLRQAFGGQVSIRRRIATVVAAFGLFAIAVTIWAPTVGSTSISLARAFDRSIPWDDNVDAQIFFVARLPRVLARGLLGAPLAAAGGRPPALARH